jgi:DNA polymerase I-like protein with 3'-5' exonuclease and polymerase domains
VADVETFGLDPKNGKLLGVSICPVDDTSLAQYIFLQWYDFKTSSWVKHPDFDKQLNRLRGALTSWDGLIGHNYSYDKLWLDHVLGIHTKWHACTRLMWHMASAPMGPKPYGLKDAQVELLGWDKRGDTELSAQVEARGGKLKEGGHYLADKELLAKYACLDASSTAQVYNKLKPFFDEHDYWWMLDKMVEYSWLLQECTLAGIRVDVPALDACVEALSNTKEAYASRFLEITKPYIERLERLWREDRAAKYVSADARQRFLATWDLQKKFNLSSDKDKRELFYSSMNLPIVIETEGGKPSTSLEAIKIVLKDKELLEAYENTESAETLLNSFAKPWQGVVESERLHPRFNPCGTVSYRLSGFKPYLLNAPFDEKELMSCLKCDEGWEGVHADFVSVEPAVTAHYSQDPSLLKVFRDGLGDVYLDLALTLFPDDKELKAGYSPQMPVTSVVKEKFKRQRKVAKIIQLAVQYTGTWRTVQRNLNLEGFPTTPVEASELVQAYWKHFYRVASMNEALFLKNIRDGYLRNVVGRIIRVPYPRYKDLPNRFIQSSAHDLLSFWVIIINRMVREKGLRAKTVIIDCHDSTSWQAPKEEVQELETCFKEALTELNGLVRMSVPIKADFKRFITLAGLKGQEI